jgi:hypothetical protein
VNTCPLPPIVHMNIIYIYVYIYVYVYNMVDACLLYHPTTVPTEGGLPVSLPLSFDVESIVLCNLGPLCVLEFVHGVLSLGQPGRAPRRLLLPTTQLAERHTRARNRQTRGHKHKEHKRRKAASGHQGPSLDLTPSYMHMHFLSHAALRLRSAYLLGHVLDQCALLLEHFRVHGGGPGRQRPTLRGHTPSSPLFAPMPLGRLDPLLASRGGGGTFALACSGEGSSRGGQHHIGAAFFIIRFDAGLNPGSK